MVVALEGVRIARVVESVEGTSGRVEVGRIVAVDEVAPDEAGRRIELGGGTSAVARTRVLLE